MFQKCAYRAGDPGTYSKSMCLRGGNRSKCCKSLRLTQGILTSLYFAIGPIVSGAKVCVWRNQSGQVVQKSASRGRTQSTFCRSLRLAEGIKPTTVQVCVSRRGSNQAVSKSASRAWVHSTCCRCLRLAYGILANVAEVRVSRQGSDHTRQKTAPRARDPSKYC